MEPWTSLIKELGKAPNVYCKVSGIITEADHQNWQPEDIIPFLDVVFEAFGTNRIMFGSDWPVCLLAGTYDQVFDLIDHYIQDFEPSEREKVFGGNALEFYQLN